MEREVNQLEEDKDKATAALIDEVTEEDKVPHALHNFHMNQASQDHSYQIYPTV